MNYTCILLYQKHAVSTVLFQQATEDGQKLVYYVSKALVDAETRSQVE